MGAVPTISTKKKGNAMPFKSREKYLAYLKEYNARRYREAYDSRVQELKDYLGGECVWCETTEKLEFDHVNPNDKSFSILKRWNVSMEILIPELKKCQLLCFDCHLTKTQQAR